MTTPSTHRGGSYELVTADGGRYFAGGDFAKLCGSIQQGQMIVATPAAARAIPARSGERWSVNGAQVVAIKGTDHA